MTKTEQIPAKLLSFSDHLSHFLELEDNVAKIDLNITHNNKKLFE